jgi:hypothetical protein
MNTLHALLACLAVTTVSATDGALVSERVVAGGPDTFMEVRHLVLRGSQEDIGAALAEYAVRELDTVPWTHTDPRITRVQRGWFEREWPAQHARMAGSARAFGLDLDDDAVNFANLAYDVGDTFGCSVVAVPGHLMADGRSVVSRYLDFPTGDMNGRRPGAAGRAAFSRPFVIETHPDEGYASLVMTSTDLLGAAFDGMNEHGLVAALLTDRELLNEHDMTPTLGQGVGLSEIQLIRWLLETCRDAEQAREALLRAKHYFAYVPCHYLVSDPSGDSFVFELDASRNVSHFMTRPGQALVTTNFMLHQHDRWAPLPEDGPGGSYWRYDQLTQRFDDPPARLDLEGVAELHACAAQAPPAPPEHVPYAPLRTLWHALYQPRAQALSIAFYLGDLPDGSVRWSERVSFSLDKD